MTEESVVHTIPRSERRLAIPRGWVILSFALAGWLVLAVLVVGVWSVLAR